MLDFVAGVPLLLEGSPALDTGLGTLSFSGVPMEEVLEYLSTDYLGNPRSREGDSFPNIDRGAIER